eukprot:2967609-Amphidinium_carterae.1
MRAKASKISKQAKPQTMPASGVEPCPCVGKAQRCFLLTATSAATTFPKQASEYWRKSSTSD